MHSLRFLYLTIIFYQDISCIRNKNPIKRTVWHRLLGKNVTSRSYKNAGDHLVSTDYDLACNFEKSGCCWSNSNPPTDQLDWHRITGASEPNKLMNSFGTGVAPSGTALGIGSETATDGSSQTAQLYSCPIQCAGGPITVTFKHWHTSDVTIKVCLEADKNGPLKNCMTLPNSSGYADSVLLPADKNIRIVIVANGFTNKRGSIGIIDDINVQFIQCSAVTTTIIAPETTMPSTEATIIIEPTGCKDLSCDFEQGNTCYFTNDQSGISNVQWAAVTGPFQNLLTGIKKPASGQYMAAVYLKPGDTAVMSADINFPSGFIMQFQGYRATQGIDLSTCCDGITNCPYSIMGNVQGSDYRIWKNATVICPVGTHKVFFQAKNGGSNFGAAGLDNIQVFSSIC